MTPEPGQRWRHRTTRTIVEVLCGNATVHGWRDLAVVYKDGLEVYVRPLELALASFTAVYEPLETCSETEHPSSGFPKSAKVKLQ